MSVSHTYSDFRDQQWIQDRKRDRNPDRGSAGADAGPEGGAAGKRARTVGVVRAARELELRRGEFELATQLGHVRAIAGPAAGRRQVTRQEIDRLRAAQGFPDTLRQRVRTVGTAEGAELISVSPGRFTRLARAGCVAPVTFYLNRYRAVVWLYLADELKEFAGREPALLTGRLPLALRHGPDSEDDRRPRNWRGRRIGHLLHQSADPWERAAVVGSVLDPGHLAELVRDPYERACLNRLRPDLAPGHPASEAAQATVRRLLLADDPDEIQWHRGSLDMLLEEARRTGPAPRPGEPVPGPDRQPVDGPPAGDPGDGNPSDPSSPNGLSDPSDLCDASDPCDPSDLCDGRAAPVPVTASGSPLRQDGRKGLLNRLRMRRERRSRHAKAATIFGEACSSEPRDGRHNGHKLPHGSTLRRP
ncbi:hypothetical protein KQY30_01590 [Streptomyces sp. GMY02]|uniref:DUF6397 family protein n=1 Tax=Streptomyces sp. GMY02 TaxID=1333528 RepID=UPI001C2BA9F6|nr:DUF6397 family protein [Streptomyces sp. GMY02]QXE33186.1 hypothetical protein KQY30_01590 [Streptomyces sp. GMY02]